MPQRYTLWPESFWDAAPPWVRGLHMDLKTIESTGVQATGNVDAGQITTGVIAPERLGTGTITGNEVLYSSGQWGAAPSGGGSVDTSGLAPKDSPTFTGTTVVGLALDGSAITQGTVASARLGSGTRDSSTVLFGDSAFRPLNKAAVGLGNVDNTADAAKTFAGSQITSGTIAPARLGTGTADGTKFLADDGVWRTPPSGAVITSGPYSLDPKRAPSDTVVLVPAGTPVLTHVGNRFKGSPAGQTATTALQQLSGGLVFGQAGTATLTFGDDGAVNGESLHINTPTTGTDLGQCATTFPAGITEATVNVVLTMPSIPTVDMRVAQLTETTNGGLLIAAIVRPGTTAGKVILTYDDVKNSGSWNYSSAEFTWAPTMRFCFQAKIGTTGTDGAVKATSYAVDTTNGTETQVGAPYEVTGITIATSNTIRGVTLGKMNGVDLWTGSVVRIDGVRVAHGPGAYGVTLKDERLYPEPI